MILFISLIEKYAGYMNLLRKLFLLICCSNKKEAELLSFLSKTVIRYMNVIYNHSIVTEKHAGKVFAE